MHYQGNLQNTSGNPGALAAAKEGYSTAHPPAHIISPKAYICPEIKRGLPRLHHLKDPSLNPSRCYTHLHPCVKRHKTLRAEARHAKLESRFGKAEQFPDPPPHYKKTKTNRPIKRLICPSRVTKTKKMHFPESHVPCGEEFRESETVKHDLHEDLCRAFRAHG